MGSDKSFSWNKSKQSKRDALATDVELVSIHKHTKAWGVKDTLACV